MSAQIAAYGRLVADPKPIETRSGKAMTAARLAVNVEARIDGESEAEGTLWLSVLAFGRVAEDLARSAKGEPVSVSGRVRLERYQSRDGEERETWQVLADSVVSSRSVRPRGGRRGGGSGENSGASRQDPDRGGSRASRPSPAATSAPADFDDDIPF